MEINSPNSIFNLRKPIHRESTGPAEGHPGCASTIQQIELQGSLCLIKNSPGNMGWYELSIPGQISYFIFMFIKCYTSLRWSGSPILEHGSAVDLTMAYETKSTWMAVGNPGSCGYRPGHPSYPHPICSRGASVLHRAHNNKHKITASPKAAAWAQRGAGIPNVCPNVLLVPHAGLEKGLWEKRGHLRPPHREEGHPALPPRRSRSPRGRGVPGGAGSTEPRGTRRYL